MPHLREEVLNSYLGLLLDSFDGISATTEMRTSRSAIDITVTHSGVPDPVPILVEAKIGDSPANRRKAANQARSRLHGASRSLAFGLCYSCNLRDASVSAHETQDALASASITFAPVRRTDSKTTWREGTVADLANSLRNTDLSRQRVADEIEWTVRKAAKLLYVQDCAEVVANALTLPNTKDKDLRAAALVGSLILSNAALIHQRLRLVPTLSTIPPLETILADQGNASSRIRDAWGVPITQVVPPRKLPDVVVKMLRTELMQCHGASTLQHRPEALDAVGVGLSPDVLAYGVLDSIMIR